MFLPLLIVATLWWTVNGDSRNPRFFKYPEGLIPKASTKDFQILEASILFSEMTSGEAMEKYKFSDQYLGFICNTTTDVVKHVMVKATSRNFTNDIGEMRIYPGLVLYEQYPQRDDNTVYINKYFDYTEHPNQVRGECLLEISSSDNGENLCDLLPRCIGFLEGYCLFSSASRNLPLRTLKSRNVYHEKRRTHNAYLWIKDNGVVFGILYTVAVGVATFSDKVFNTVSLKRFTKKVMKKVFRF
jgi:hypothetical protein